MRITTTTQSRIASTDFSNLPFGSIFTDHMLVATYENGVWGEPEIKPYGPLTFHPSLHALHYGQAVFEGMKAFRGADGKVRLFRPEENWKRLNRSAERMAMPAITREIFIDGLLELVRLDRDWVPTTEGTSLYIRPFMFSSSEFVAARPSDKYTFVILCSPSGAYYSGAVKVKVEENYVRSAAGGVGYAKAAGNYGAAFYPTRLAVAEGFNQLIWTDHKEHKYIEESGTMNIMFNLNGTLLTPSLSERILAGKTRDTLLKLAAHLGIPFEERPVSVQEIIEGLRNGKLKEAFGVGTAALVSPISAIGFRGEILEVPVPEQGMAQTLKKALDGIRSGAQADPFGWMVEV
jgi:branched-chain amino acid aminotransferase